MKKLLMGLALAGLASATSYANTVKWSDTDNFNPGINLFAVGSSTSGELNIKTLDGNFAFDVAGFVPGTDVATFAIVEFSFTTSSSTQVVRWNLKDALNSLIETGTDNSSPTQFIVGPDSVGISLLASLNADGLLNYTLVKESGTARVTLTSAALIAGVPDGGATAMLLGVGLLGLGAVRRKIA